MAHIQKYHISEVLQDVCKKMSAVSKNVYPDHRPAAKNEQMSDLIVVSIPTQLNEQNAFQKGFLRIEIIVRDKTDGYANIVKLQSMLDAVIAKFPLVIPRYSATSPRLMLKGSDGLGFTIWNIQASLIINTTDSYK